MVCMHACICIYKTLLLRIHISGERERERVRETDRQTVRQREKGYKGMPSLFIPTPVRPDRLS